MKDIIAQALWDRRDRIRIMAEILEAAKESQVKTRIMYRANLSFNQVKEYLAFLTEMGLLRVKVKNGQKVYETTVKGRVFLENYWDMIGFLRGETCAEPQILVR